MLHVLAWEILTVLHFLKKEARYFSCSIYFDFGTAKSTMSHYYLLLHCKRIYIWLIIQVDFENGHLFHFGSIEGYINDGISIKENFWYRLMLNCVNDDLSDLLSICHVRFIFFAKSCIQITVSSFYHLWKPQKLVWDYRRKRKLDLYAYVRK